VNALIMMEKTAAATLLRRSRDLRVYILVLL